MCPVSNIKYRSINDTQHKIRAPTIPFVLGVYGHAIYGQALYVQAFFFFEVAVCCNAMVFACHCLCILITITSLLTVFKLRFDGFHRPWSTRSTQAFHASWDSGEDQEQNVIENPE